MVRLPPIRSDFFALAFLLVSVFSVFLFEILIVRPYLVERHNYQYMLLHISMAFTLLFNVLSNLYLLYRTDTSTRGLVMPTNMLPGWHFCMSCEANSPPRSYHCKQCDRCILRRDHHCIFSACCVGHKNYKYYMGLLLQLSIGAVYASFFHLPYVWSNMGGFSIQSFFSHFLPIPFYIFGKIDSWTLMCNFLSMLCITGSLFASGLFVYHMMLLVHNQTTYERQKHISIYRLKDWRANLSQVLGSRWPLTLIITPLITSPLSCDGTQFPTIMEHKYTR